MHEVGGLVDFTFRRRKHPRRCNEGSCQLKSWPTIGEGKTADRIAMARSAYGRVVRNLARAGASNVETPGLLVDDGWIKR